MRKLLLATLLLLLAGCASYDGRGLRPGQSGENEVLGLMGSPAWQWRNADGSRLLAYPRGPMGVHTYMAHIGADGKLARIENVLTPEFFARIEAGLQVKDVFVIFDYGTFPTKTVLDTMGVTVHSLATWQDVLPVARQSASFKAAELAELETFLADPIRWSHVHGGKSSVKP